jgi:hypothetical protein
MNGLHERRTLRARRACVLIASGERSPFDLRWIAFCRIRSARNATEGLRDLSSRCCKPCKKIIASPSDRFKGRDKTRRNERAFIRSDNDLHSFADNSTDNYESGGGGGGETEAKYQFARTKRKASHPPPPRIFATVTGRHVALN